MSLFVKMFHGGEKVRKKPGRAEETEKPAGGEELLMKKKDFLQTKIDHELLVAKKNSSKNRRVALQALRRKKWYEKHLKYIDCAVQAMKSTHEHVDIINKVNNLIKGITEEQDVTQDMTDGLCTCLSFGVEFDEDKLLTELERLEKNLDDFVFDKDQTEERVPCAKVPSTGSPLPSAKTEEDEVEDDLEYLRRWASEPS